MTKAPERVELPEEEAPSEGFSRLLAIAIVLATLLVATVEYLHAVDHSQADAAGVEAQKLGVERQGEAVRGQDQGRLLIDNYALVEEELTRASNSLQQIFVSPTNSETTRLQKENDLYDRIAALNSTTPADPAAPKPITPDATTSPAHDPRFPTLVLAQQTRASDRLFALQDANNDKRSALLKRLSTYEVLLTVLAVSIYLLGLSLTLPRAVGRALSSLAVVAILGAGSWTGILQLSRPSDPPEAAADEYADGMQALQGYYVRNGTDGLTEAKDHFSKAISLRPDFAQAYVERAQTVFLIASPQRLDSTQGLSTSDAITAAIGDLEQAYSLGLRTKEVLNGLADDRVLLGLQKNDTSRINAALDAVTENLKLDDSDAEPYLVRGVAQLALGQADGAKASFNDAVSRIVFSDLAAKTPRDPGKAEELVGGGLTQLDLLASARSDLAGAAGRMKELLASGVASGAGQKSFGDQRTVDSIKADHFPGQLQWSGVVTGYSPDKDVVSAQWYRRDPGGTGWAVLPSISGAISLTADTPGGADHWFSLQNYLQISGRCLDDGDYKVEVFINGHLAGGAQTTASYGTLVATPMPELQLTLCRPHGYSRDTNAYIPGFADGYSSVDNASAVYLYRIQSPGTDLGADPAGEVTQIRDLAVHLLDQDQKLGGTPTNEQDDTSLYFLALSPRVTSQYDLPGNRSLVVAAGLAPDKSVIVVADLGPTTSVTSGELNQIFNSIIRKGEGQVTAPPPPAV